LEIADHDVRAFLGGQARVAEHLVGLAHAGGRAEGDGQEPARLLHGGRHAPSLGSGEWPSAACLDRLQTSAAELWGAFMRAVYGDRMSLRTSTVAATRRRLPELDDEAAWRGALAGAASLFALL